MKHEASNYCTRRMLADAFKKAARSKPLSKITVSEIVRECGLNRKTFYYHFLDIYDLLAWIIDEETVKAVQQFDLLNSYREAVRFVMEYVAQNDYLLCFAQDPIGRDTLKRFILSEFTGIIRSVIDEGEKQSGAVLEPEFKEYAARFYTEALTSMTMEWAKNHTTQNMEKTIDHLNRLLSAALDSMFLLMSHQAKPK